MLQMRRGGHLRGGPRGSRFPYGGGQRPGPLSGNRPQFRQRGDECRDRKGAGHAADVLGLLRRAKPSETGHSLKVRFPNPKNNGEHIWIAEVKKAADGRYSGRFANAPRDLPGKKAGDVAEFREADISDWMFTRNGKIVGGETIKPLLKAMPKADADALRARMETP